MVASFLLNLTELKPILSAQKSKEYEMKLYALTISVLLSSPSLADDISIEMLNKDSDGNKMIYSQEVANINVGDTVTWLPTSKGHNVEMISSPNDMKLKSKNGKEVKLLLILQAFIIIGALLTKAWA